MSPVRCSVTRLGGEVDVRFHNFPAQKSHSETQDHPTGRSDTKSPWWPSKKWFPHLLRLCVDHPLFFWILLSQQGYVSDGKSYHVPGAHMEAPMQHYQAARFSKEVSRLAAAARRPSTNRMW